MDDVFRYIWGEYRVWAETSRALKRRITGTGTLVLLVTLLGTACGALAPLVPATHPIVLAVPWAVTVMPWVSAALLGLATFLTNQLLGESERMNWVKARAVAEAFKSEAHKYVTGAPPYDTPDAPHLLAQKAADLQRVVPGVITAPVTPEARAHGSPAGRWSVDEYITHRMREQIDAFYRPAVARHAHAVSTAKRLALGFGALAVLLSLAGSSFGRWPAAVLGVVTTAAVSVAAWFQGGHHQQLALNYQSTISKLELLLAQHRASRLAGTQLILDAEAIMQAEHAAWLAEWQAAPAPGPTPAAPPAGADAEVPPGQPVG